MARALLIITLICTIVAGAWYYRSNSFSCGQFDNRSACVSSVVLDTSTLGVESPNFLYRTLDLSSSGTQVLAAFEGMKLRSESFEPYAALILFDSKTGKPIQVLREFWGQSAGFQGAALSKDGELVASYGWGELVDGTEENSLLIQAIDGVTKHVIYDVDDKSKVYDCVSRMDFSEDGKLFQCSSTLYNLEANTSQRYSEDEEEVLNNADVIAYYPQHAEFSAGGSAFSPQGITTNFNADRDQLTNVQTMKLTFPDERVRSYPRFTEFDNSYDVIVFSPDGQKVLDLHIQDKNRQGILQRLELMPKTHVVTWLLDLEAETEANDIASIPVVMTNRTLEEAWSRDGEYFALLGDDLTLSVFDASQ